MIGAKHHTHCAAEGCRTAITRGWFCKDHYFAIPAPLRAAVLAAYNAARAGHCRASRQEQDQLNRAYGEAYRACTDYLRTARRTPAQAMATTAIDAQGRDVRFVGGRML